MKHQTHEKKDLHICIFPSSDVYTFVEMHLRVIDRDTNTTVYNRTVCVEDQRKCHRSSYEFLCSFHSCTVYEIKLNISAYIFLQDLLYPPSNISLHPTGEVGQLLVEWKRPKNGWIPGLNPQYEIRYSSKNTSSTVGPVSLSLTQTQKITKNIEILLHIEALHLLNAIYTHSS